MCPKQDGYRLIRANQLLASIAAFDAGEITFRALKVYLASFGTENIGTGQLCVYGTLPANDAATPTAPSGLKVDIAAGMATLTWNASAGASYYRVRRTSTRDPKPQWAATGLTSPTFVEPAPARRDTTTYTVFAIGQAGVSGGSASVTVPKPTP